MKSRSVDGDSYGVGGIGKADRVGKRGRHLIMYMYEPVAYHRTTLGANIKI